MRVFHLVCLLSFAAFIKAQDEPEGGEYDGEEPPPPPGYDEPPPPPPGYDDPPPPPPGGDEPPPPPPGDGGGGSSGGCTDGASWCGEIKAHQCYRASDVCCVSCKGLKTGGSEACAYGDKHPGCAEYTKEEGYCDVEGVKDSCCESCK